MTATSRLGGLRQQVGSFAVIGLLSTLANVVLFYLLNRPLPAQVANALALIVTTIANTAANRHFTFGVRTRQGAARAQAQGLVLWLVMWAATALALWSLHRFDPHASHLWQSLVQFGGNVVATVIRFVLLRRWFAASPTETAAVALDPVPPRTSRS